MIIEHVMKHSGITGNDKAHELARRGPESIYMTSRPVYGIINSSAKRRIKEINGGKIIKHFKDLEQLHLHLSACH